MSNLRKRARKLADEFGWAMTDESIDGIADLCAAIRAEAKAEGWDDAVRALRDNYGSHPAADWLERNRPSPVKERDS